MASFVCLYAIVEHCAGGSFVNNRSGWRVGAVRVGDRMLKGKRRQVGESVAGGGAEGRGRRWATTAAQTLKGGRSAGVSGGTAALPNDMMLDRATAPA